MEGLSAGVASKVGEVNAEIIRRDDSRDHVSDGRDGETMNGPRAISPGENMIDSR